jgi:hypothetical protein
LSEKLSLYSLVCCWRFFVKHFDANVQNRKIYHYKLGDIDLNGTSIMYGPVIAAPRWIFGLGK